jgi:AraC-like DNA-binding protein
MAKQVPVLQINNFQQAVHLHPHIYAQLLEEHLAQYQFIKTPHRHNFYCIFLFTHGKGMHTIDFTDYAVYPGCVFFMSPAQVHSWELSADAAGYVIFFDPEFYLLEYSHKRLSDFPFFHFTATPYLSVESAAHLPINDLFVRMYEEYKGDEPRKEEIIRSYLNILLLKLNTLYNHANQPHLSLHVHHQIRQLEALIEKHYLSHQSADEYADLLNISAKQLYTICQTALHKSLRTLLQERLILEAKRLLVHTDATVAQVAEKLNYTDNSYFNRFFRKAVGLTPEQFRQQFQ